MESTTKRKRDVYRLELMFQADLLKDVGIDTLPQAIAMYNFVWNASDSKTHEDVERLMHIAVDLFITQRQHVG